MAVTLLLIVLNVVCGRVRLCLLAWLALIPIAFNPVSWGSDVFAQEVPRWLWQVILVSGALAMAIDPLLAAVRHHSRPCLLYTSRPRQSSSV